MKNIVLDSYAVLAFYANETGADEVRSLFLKAAEGEIRLLMSLINLGEVWYTFKRKTSLVEADRIIEEILGVNIEVISPDWKQTRQASIYKSNGGISYADCFAAALAKQNNAQLVTGDKEFNLVEKEISIHWI